MPVAPLPSDATIRSIVCRLNHPLRYVLNVYTHMWSCKRKFGNASVTIGATGEAKAPHYKIEYSNDRGQHLFGIYRGLGHRPFGGLGVIGFNDILLSDDPHEVIVLDAEIGERDAPKRPDHLLLDRNWSTRAMSLEEVGLLRIELGKRGRR